MTGHILHKTAVRGAPPRRRGKRLPTGKLLPREEYRYPILEALYERGGSAPASQVIATVDKRLNDRLTELDRAAAVSGQVRWANRAQWQRVALVREGLIKSDSPRGSWELTPAGIALVEQHRRGR
ncbi:MAG TPA: winged helix-turn-helix domain-containing protein [Thermoleophilia bacterium]|nr:winged helix-turn-helix domain-containing protein [Thermoleophilia bacterium]